MQSWGSAVIATCLTRKRPSRVHSRILGNGCELSIAQLGSPARMSYPARMTLTRQRRSHARFSIAGILGAQPQALVVWHLSDSIAIIVFYYSISLYYYASQLQAFSEISLMRIVWHLSDSIAIIIIFFVVLYYHALQLQAFSELSLMRVVWHLLDSQQEKLATWYK